ncbi:hypothetical protein ACFVZJ_22255, partial [Streptomyces sp. NPDC058322]|uniref:hypothetical protein n=1 Tax=Streptomyces sp. NPDC058322 TaxID=3346446 RepID=UPI0036EB0DB2
MRTAGPAGPGLNPTLWDDEAYRAATTQSKWKYCVAVIREAPDVTVLTEKYLRAVPQFLAGARRQLRHLAALSERPNTSSIRA